MKTRLELQYKAYLQNFLGLLYFLVEPDNEIVQTTV